jgi:hypothetical protein
MKLNALSMMIAAGAMAAAGSTASAQLLLQDLNSSADFSLNTQAGQHSWRVDGIEHMFQQWFWTRADGDQFERSLDALALVGVQVTDTNPFVDPRPDTFDALYRDPRFDVELNVTLRGGTAGSNRSDLGEQIRITNTTNTFLPFHFFQYVDLDLNNSIADTVVQITGGNTARQADGIFGVSETVVTPMPSHYETNFYPITLGSLNDAGPTVLNDNAGPLGPGDLTWAFQWDFNIAPGQSVLISKDKSIVPAPGSAALLALGGLAAARRRRRA